MGISALAADERVADVRFDEDRIVVDLMDGRTIAAPLAWFPRLANERQDTGELLRTDVRRLVRLVAVEVEAEAFDPQDRRHP